MSGTCIRKSYWKLKKKRTMFVTLAFYSTPDTALWCLTLVKVDVHNSIFCTSTCALAFELAAANRGDSWGSEAEHQSLADLSQLTRWFQRKLKCKVVFSWWKWSMVVVFQSASQAARTWKNCPSKSSMVQNHATQLRWGMRLSVKSEHFW